MTKSKLTSDEIKKVKTFFNSCKSAKVDTGNIFPVYHNEEIINYKMIFPSIIINSCIVSFAELKYLIKTNKIKFENQTSINPEGKFYFVF